MKLISKIKDVCYVYWIHLPEHTDMTTQGYIGVSSNPPERLKHHIYTAKKKVRSKRTEFLEKLSAGACLQEILICSTRQYCLELEAKLRPTWAIGWNLSPGGFRVAKHETFKKVIYKGKEVTLEYLSKISGKSKNCISKRLIRGWTPEEAASPNKKPTSRNKKILVKNILFELNSTAATTASISRKLNINSKYCNNHSELIPHWLTKYFLLPNEKGRIRKVSRGLSISSFNTILTIERLNIAGTSINNISRILDLNYGSVKRMLKYLEDAEYV